jgi:hypothetical protein
MLRIDDLFKTVVSAVETTLLSIIILLECLFRGRPAQAPQTIAAARLMRRGEFVSGRTLMFFATAMLLVTVSYTRIDQALSQARSALSSPDTTGSALAALVLTAVLDLLVRTSIGRHHGRPRRLNMLRDGVSCWLALFALVIFVVSVATHGEYWTWRFVEHAQSIGWPLAGVAAAVTALSLYLFVPLVWHQRGRRVLPVLLILAIAPVAFLYALIAGAAAWELDKDDRGDANLLTRTSCWRTDDGVIHVAATLRNRGKESLWVQDAGDLQLRTYVGGLQTERYAGSPILGGEEAAPVTLDIENGAEGLIEPGGTMIVSGVSSMPVPVPSEQNGLWTCEYDGSRVANERDLPSRGVIRVAVPRRAAAADMAGHENDAAQSRTGDRSVVER